MRSILQTFTILISLFLAVPSTSTAQATIELNPVKDNTLFETDSGELSNGAGEFLFFGQTGANAANKLRRALLSFDVAGILPAGAMVKEARLTVEVSRVNMSDALTSNLHRVSADWGEGASDAPGQEGGGAQSESDDATWLHTFFDSATWASPGGDFATDASSSADIADLGSYTFEGLGADVQSMFDTPTENFGWIILGDESFANGAKRIDGRFSSGTPPVLTVVYDSAGVTSSEFEIPNSISFSEVYPNPFSSNMTFTLGVETTGHVNVDVFDFMGRQVADLLSENMYAGQKEVLNFKATNLPAGNYFVVARTASDTKMQKVTLIK